MRSAPNLSVHAFDRFAAAPSPCRIIGCALPPDTRPCPAGAPRPAAQPSRAHPRFPHSPARRPRHCCAGADGGGEAGAREGGGAGTADRALLGCAAAGSLLANVFPGRRARAPCGRACFCCRRSCGCCFSVAQGLPQSWLLPPARPSPAEAVEEMLQELLPHRLTEYLYDLASELQFALVYYFFFLECCCPK